MKECSAILVVGGTSTTGRRLIRELLDFGHHVTAIVASRQRLIADLDELPPQGLLHVVEARSLSRCSLSDFELQRVMRQVDVVFCCLESSFWRRRLITRAVKRLTKAAIASPRTKKFVLLGSDCVVHPLDSPIPVWESLAVVILGFCIPSRADHNRAARYLYNSRDDDLLEWTVIRAPSVSVENNMVWQLLDMSSLLCLNDNLVTAGPTPNRVASYMVQMIRQREIWNKYKFQMPILRPRSLDALAIVYPPKVLSD